MHVLGSLIASRRSSTQEMGSRHTCNMHHASYAGVHVHVPMHVGAYACSCACSVNIIMLACHLVAMVAVLLGSDLSCHLVEPATLGVEVSRDVLAVLVVFNTGSAMHRSKRNSRSQSVGGGHAIGRWDTVRRGRQRRQNGSGATALASRSTRVTQHSHALRLCHMASMQRRRGRASLGARTIAAGACGTGACRTGGG